MFSVVLVIVAHVASCIFIKVLAVHIRNNDTICAGFFQYSLRNTW
jgi:hypothetical protein